MSESARGQRTMVRRWTGATHPLACAVLVWLGGSAVVSLGGSATGRLGAQEVVGFVETAETGERVEGAMVVLTDAAGEVIDRALTNARGAFVVAADEPGAHFLRIDRIGVATAVDGPFDVTAGGAFRSVSVSTVAIRLRGITVTGQKRCDVSPAVGEETARVWDEIRKALEAARWTAENSVYRYTLYNYRHLTDYRRREIYEEQRSFDRSREVTPYHSKPIEELVANGFVQADGDDAVFYAPDATGFLSTEFLDTHCFGLESRNDEIGLTFEPVPHRILPEIAGVMWLDPETAVLKRLEFTYVNVGNPYRLEAANGHVGFTAMPNGTWIVKDWEIHMPRWIRSDDEPSGRAYWRTRGGVTWRVGDHNGNIVLEAATATLGGRIASGSVRPDNEHVATLAGDTAFDAHVVSILGTGESTHVEPDGSFVLPGLAAGLQRVEVRHPLIDSMGLRVAATPVETTLGEVLAVELPAPRLVESMVDACILDGNDSPRPPLLARLLGPAAPMDSAEVRLEWDAELWPRSEVDDTPLAMPAPHGPGIKGRELRWSLAPEDEGPVLRTRTDARGMLMFCGPPYEAGITMTISQAGESWVRQVPETADAPAVILVYNLFPRNRR